MKRTTSILALLLLVAVPLFAQWQGEVRITDTYYHGSYTTHSGGRSIVTDEDNVHLVWNEIYSGRPPACYKNFPIGNPPAPGEGDTVRCGGFPVIATDGENIHIDSWSSIYPYNYLRFRELSGDSWGPIIQHGGPVDQNEYPAIVDDAEGNTHCTFVKLTNSIYYQRRNAGCDTFTSPVKVYGSPDLLHPAICLTSDGAIHISFVISTDNRVIHAWSTDNGATWSTEYATDKNTAKYDYIRTSICHDSKDDLYIAYTNYNYPRNLLVASDEGGSWSSVNVSRTDAYWCYSPSICCDINDNIWVTWNHEYNIYPRTDHTEIYYNRRDAKTGLWTGPLALTEHDGYSSVSSHIAADPHGNVHVCWSDSRHSTDPEIYYNWFKGKPLRDVGPVSIDAPPDTVWSEYAYTPRATVANLSEDSTFTFDVACEFDSAGAVVYSDTTTVIDLAAGDSIQVSFVSWTAGEADGLNYAMTVTTLLEDNRPSNDTLSKTITAIWPPRDVAPVAILTPPDRVWAGCPHTPRAIVANFWEDPASFDVRCEFDSAGVIIYSETATVTDLVGGDSVLVEFPSWSAGAVDEFTYLVTVTTLLAKDLTPENDTIAKQVAALRAVPDLDIQDYAGNLSANTMQLTGVPNSIVVGAYVMSNPDNWEKNVDLFDGPANIDLELTYSCTDLSTYGGGWTIGAANIDPDLNEVSALDLGKARQNILQVYIPNKAHFETYVGKVTALGTAEDGSTDADEFTLEVNIVVPKGGGKLSSFSGDPLASGNRLYWSNFGFGEQGFNLYRAESEEFTKLNTELMDLTEYTDYDVAAAVSYQYKLGLAMGSGSEILIGPLTLTSSENVGLPVLYQNWPNPWMEQTEISCFLPQDVSSLTLKVYDVSGKLVRTLASGAYESGHHSVVWDGTDERGLSVSSGVYFYRFKAGDYVETARMVILR